MEPTEPIKEYVLDKIRKIKKYFPDPIQAHVVLSTERHLHTVDVNITLHNGILLKSSESTEDMYSSIDLVMAKIERQVRRYKDKIRDHKPGSSPPFEVRHQVVSESHDLSSAPVDGDSKPRVINDSKFYARPMSLDEAIMQMNLIENEFLVFQNVTSGEINVIYRRRDGNFGLIETGHHPASA
jgi:putative sigma-54 modulation protein